MSRILRRNGMLVRRDDYGYYLEYRREGSRCSPYFAERDEALLYNLVCYMDVGYGYAYEVSQGKWTMVAYRTRMIYNHLLLQNRNRPGMPIEMMFFNWKARNPRLGEVDRR